MSSNADAGLAGSAQRSMEHGDDSGLGRASTGDAAGGAAGPRIDRGGQARPGSAGGAPGAADAADAPASDSRASADAAPARDDGEEGEDGNDAPWRHAPVAPKDEGPLESLGRAIGEGLTGADTSTTGKLPGRG